jgi:hypothetical protein
MHSVHSEFQRGPSECQNVRNAPNELATIEQRKRQLRRAAAGAPGNKKAGASNAGARL